MFGTKQPTKTDYKDGRVKQSFKDETDINKILKLAQKSGTISHLNKYEARYGDFANFDFFEAQLQLAKGGEIFDALPSEVRREFNQSPAQFFKYVNDPERIGRLKKLLPDLAKPGRQNISVGGDLPADAAKVADAAAAPALAPEPKKEPEAALKAREPPSTSTT